MVDILKKLCKNYNIELSYVNNKVVILSCNFKNNHPMIRVHKIFKECNETIAYAIIGYCTKAEKRENNLKIIKDYADKRFNSQRYRITAPNDEFYNEVVKVIIPEDFKQNGKSALLQLNISSITKKGFYGDVYTINPDESIKVDESDILEVDITVNHFNT